jgi:hypothetical protein
MEYAAIHELHGNYFANPYNAAYVGWRRRRPPALGDLRRVTPIDANWGFERGTPIDRVYVEEFVGSHAVDIHGRILEIAAPDYTIRFGRDVERVDVLMATEGNPQATIVGDLADAPQIPSDSFDCAIVTQTLQFVYDVRAALATLNEKQRMAVLLHKFEEMSYTDIAAALDMTPAAVKSLLSRARDNLREKLEPYVKQGTLGSIQPE